MARFLGFFGKVLNDLLHVRIPLPLPTISQVLSSLSVLGAIGLGYLYGAAVMFYQWPSVDFLDKCFAGARALLDRGRSTLVQPSSGTRTKKWEGVSMDKKAKTCDGFTLYTTTDGARATLIDMRGNVVHRWELPFSQVWPRASHVTNPLADDHIHWFRCYLYPNGDLLAIYHADGDSPYGYGLVKLDKNSKLLWAYADCVHHDVEVGEDGAIYTLTQKILTQAPDDMKSFLTVPLLADSLVVLSPDGHELQRIPLLEAFRDSPYFLMLASTSKESARIGETPPIMVRKDLLHANSVRVLPRALAVKFPLFKPGQVLISLRNLDALAVVDRHSRSVVWASGGIWRAQHDADFLADGRLLVYDNMGSYNAGTRIVEYDPLTQAISWCYTNEHSVSFRAFMRGMKQRFANGNTLIVDPDAQRIFEVTRDKEVVWEYTDPSPPVPQGQRPWLRIITSARRYRPEELTFLKGVVYARP